MVDMTALTEMHSGEGARKRVARRRSAETRLKAYGIIAIVLAGLALVSLLWSVVGKAAGALTETYITLPVTIDASEVDPEGTADPRVIRRADFERISKDVLKEAFPDVTGRKDKRALYDLKSSGAAFELADLVAANPDMLGKTFDYRFLASDVTDLYLKGAFGALTARQTEGALSLKTEGKEIVVTSTANDFSAVLERVKEGLRGRAEGLRRQAALQDNGVIEFTRRAASATDDATRDKNTKLAEARAKKRDALLAVAEDLETRSATIGGDEAMDDENQSILIEVAGSWLKMTRVTPSGGIAEPVLPLIAEVTNSDDWSLYVTELPEASRKVTDGQIVWIESLKSEGKIETVFNKRFFTAGDSREPELAGIWGAAVGSFWTMLVTFVLAFPVGVLAAIYLEEFAPKNRITDFIEVNINNLAAVPSIIFGLLGLSVIIGFFGVPRSAPLAGGIVLALMTLPTIVIAARASIAAVPPSIREAALGVGASRLQATFHHVLPLALPGVMTGTIIGLARALGETAPLIMIGMVAFIVDIPGGITDSASVLPVQVYRWSDFPERAFEARTAAAICALMLFLILMNAVAVFLRKRFERRW